METFIIIATLFVIGSLAGWVIEVLFRRFFSAHKWVNPGFMVGPYIPLYGFGVVILYLLSNLNFSLIGLDETSPWTIILKIVFIAFCLVLIESNFNSSSTTNSLSATLLDNADTIATFLMLFGTDIL